jgi:hypothetical protein
MGSLLHDFLVGALGWASGTLSLFVVDWNKNQNQKKGVKALIDSDLKNLAIRLVATYSKIQRFFGVYDKKTLEKLRSIYKKYAKENESEVVSNIDKLLEKMKEAQIDELNVPREQFDALGMKTYSLPFIQFNQESLLLFDQNYQRNILEILSQINSLNEEVELVMEFYHKTFNTQGQQVRIVHNNMESCYKKIQSFNIYILDHIERVV